MRKYGLLREKITIVYGTLGAFALALGKDRSSISKKLNGIIPFDQLEIEEICKILNISAQEIPKYFFYDL